MSTLTKLAKKAKRGLIMAVKSPLLKAIPGVGTVATLAGAGVAVAQSLKPQSIRVNRPGVIDLPGGIGINLPGLGPPGTGLLGPGSARGRVQAGPKGECPRGYHLNKKPTSDGLPARSVCVRNRRVNYANGRAASRAGRRLRGTVKMLRRSFSLVSGKAPRGKFIPKKRGK